MARRIWHGAVTGTGAAANAGCAGGRGLVMATYNAYEHPDITSALRGGYPVPPQRVKPIYMPELVEIEWVETSENEFSGIIPATSDRDEEN